MLIAVLIIKRIAVDLISMLSASDIKKVNIVLDKGGLWDNIFGKPLL